MALRACARRLPLVPGSAMRLSQLAPFPAHAGRAARPLSSSAAASTRVEFPAAVPQDVARLSSGWRVQQQLVDLTAAQTKLHRDEYDSMCATHGLDAAAGASLLRSLEGAGSVVRISGAGLDSTLFLRPDEGLLRAVASNLGLAYTTTDQGRIDGLQQTLDEKLALLEPASAKKEELDLSARRATHRTIALMLGYLAAQNAFFFWMTFFVWSWDIMEPITYFWGQSFMLLCFAYFIRSEREWGFGGVQQRMVDVRRRRRYQRAGFDVSKYERDVETVELYRQRIRLLEKERI
eukprot:COSAG06_NODE_1178_length_10397_cov_22.429889_8_plen_292_part_00